jgi:transposase
MAVKITRLDLDASGLRRAAARSDDASAARRMLALALVLEGKSRSTAAVAAGMDRQSLRDWVHRYNSEGLFGLSDRPRPGPTPRLDGKQMAELAEIVAAGPDPERHQVVRWRRIDLKAVIAERFAVELHERSVGKLLKRLGLRRMSVRPKHPKSETTAQSAFKKTLPSW